MNEEMNQNQDEFVRLQNEHMRLIEGVQSVITWHEERVAHWKQLAVQCENGGQMQASYMTRADEHVESVKILRQVLR
ncbi:hypothetical protein [Paenibacillus koleovorans]|uniref:hypothetical protein n=1 Tax=Paenibacillus koleovorans TaxID=121608 RepID=UPI000FDA7BB6|nr:hypothetical protein [Paenibacillus koleovorans]